MEYHGADSDSCFKFYPRYFIWNAFGGIGVIIAWAMSLSIGSIMIIYHYHKEHNIRMRDLLGKEDVVLIFSSISVIFLASFLYYMFRGTLNTMLLIIITFSALLAFLAVPILRHPMRNNLSRWVSEHLLIGYSHGR